MNNEKKVAGLYIGLELKIKLVRDLVYQNKKKD
jgi:hypothetical protein